MTHLSDLEVKVMCRSCVIDFNILSGNAQIRRAMLSCDSSYKAMEVLSGLGFTATSHKGSGCFVFTYGVFCMCIFLLIVTSDSSVI